MELAFLNYKLDDEEINLVIHHNTITGITNDTDNKIFNLVSLKKTGKGPIIINGEKISKDDIFMNKKRISIVSDDINFPKYIVNVDELMKNYLSLYNINVKDPEKKIKDSLKIVGISQPFYDRALNTLSNSEKKLITIAMGLLSNPDTLLIEEPFKYLDLKQEKRLNMLLQKLAEQYNMTIVIKSEDVDKLYKYAKEIIVVKNNMVLLDGETKEIFQRVDYLKRNGINIPEIVKFTYQARKDKEAKIDYHSDIRDIIKDIYKHV